MYEIKEEHGSVYCTDADTGEVLYELTEPAVLFMVGVQPVIVKLGNKSNLSAIYNERLARIKATGSAELAEIANEYVLADLPKDVEILNRVYNNSGYLRVLFKDEIDFDSFK